ncbi:hypothetical protein [Pontibacter sp. G13]|uniref:hypothetical protein n=1 Tax=Pontibacter sp. G13 TaxID=3074898 RepID=UPI00288A3237|nr:hypothetical protein [Pontibacter sp. G13]WNJ20987.1 hypothetical protein RJD25_10985 [Pontibacter sp. G13]
MQLEELKILWEASSQADPEPRLDQAEIRKMLHARSDSALQRINRGIWVEVSLSIVLVIMVAALAERLPGRANIWYGVSLMILVLSGGFYWMKYRAINPSGIAPLDLKTSLNQSVRSMEFYMMIYQATITTLMPTVGAAGVLFGFYHGGESRGASFSQVPGTVWIGVAGIALIFGWGAAKLGKRYVYALYGEHVEELKACLMELNPED